MPITTKQIDKLVRDANSADGVTPEFIQDLIRGMERFPMGTHLEVPQENGDVNVYALSVLTPEQFKTSVDEHLGRNST